MSSGQLQLQGKDMIVTIAEHLNHLFYLSGRDEAKRAFKTIHEGNETPLFKLNTHKKNDPSKITSEVACFLTLDASEHQGALNFSKFRQGLASMILGIQDRVENDKNLNIMRSDSGEMLFHIPGVLSEDGETNILVCGVAQSAPGKVQIKLMYIDPSNYVALDAAQS